MTKTVDTSVQKRYNRLIKDTLSSRLISQGIVLPEDVSTIGADSLNTSSVELTWVTRESCAIPQLSLHLNLGWINELLYVDLFLDMQKGAITVSETYAVVSQVSKLSPNFLRKIEKWVDSVLEKELTH